MTELEALLKSVENRTFVGAATERITGAREGLWNMQNKPEISFKCGPYALQQILKSDQRLLTSSATNAMMEIFNYPSTQKGFRCRSGRVVEEGWAELSDGVPWSPHPVPLPIGWGEGVRRTGEGRLHHPLRRALEGGHYAAMVRQEGDRYLLEDPTFGNTVWATRAALEAETSGYFLIPPGELPRGWRSVDAKEGASVWGKGQTTGNDPGPTVHVMAQPRK
jgi:hypothetical protein